MARFTGLPMPPSTNGLWRRTRDGQVRLSDTYAAWLKEAGTLMMIARQRPTRGLFMASIRMQRGRSRIDLDNGIKACLDLLQAMGLVENDKLCERVTATWADDADGLEIDVEPVEVVEASA